jgi:hypothetical protein
MSSPLLLTYAPFKSLTLTFKYNNEELESITFQNGPGKKDEHIINLIPTKMNCVYDLLDKITHTTSSSKIGHEIKKSLFIPNIFECKLENNDTILPFESFYSNQYLNENNDCEIRINYIDKAVTFHENKLIRKNDGYCKIFFNKDNFEWKKGRITEDNKDIILKCLDYKLKYHALEDNLIENNL